MLNGCKRKDLSGNPQPVKMCLVGDMAVGKTSLAHVFLQQRFQEHYRATIGGVVMTRVLDDPFVACQVWDTAGMERYRSLLPHYMRKALCAVIVYDITSWDSYVSVRDYWLDFVDRCGDEGLVKILVGNKMDMANRRAVNSLLGAELAESRGMAFMETSAKFEINVDTMFTIAAKKAEEVLKVRKSSDSLSTSGGFGLDTPQPLRKGSKCCSSDKAF